MNLTALESSSGELELHDAECPSVRLARELGLPLITLFGCERVPEDFLVAACVEFPR